MKLTRAATSIALMGLLFVLAAPTARAQQSPTTIGLWRFDEGLSGVSATGPGSILDSSPFLNDGTPVGSPKYIQGDVPSCFGSNAAALSFAGGSQEIQLSSMFPLHVPGDVTLEFWLRYTPTGHQSVFWTRTGNTDANRFNIFVNGNGTFGFDYRSPSGQLHKLVGGLNSGIAIPSGVWTHLAIVRVGSTYHLYRDGALVQLATDTTPDLPTSTGWQISGRSGYMLRADLDEVRLTARALTPSEFLNTCSGGVGTTYCFGIGCPCGNDDPQAGCANSTGVGAELTALNSSSVSAGDLLLTVSDLPPGKNVRFLSAGIGTVLPWGDGLFCFPGGLGGIGVHSVLGQADGLGNYTLSPDLTLPNLVGQTMGFQAWYRDPAGPCGSGYNTSNALAVTYVP